MNVTLKESDRQATILALAELSLRRPGWKGYLKGIAVQMDGEAMFEEFRTTSGDLVKPRTQPEDFKIDVRGVPV